MWILSAVFGTLLGAVAGVLFSILFMAAVIIRALTELGFFLFDVVRGKRRNFSAGE